MMVKDGHLSLNAALSKHWRENMTPILPEEGFCASFECFLSTNRSPRRVLWSLILLFFHNSNKCVFSRTFYLCLFLVVEHWKNGLVPVSGGADNPF